MKNNINIYISGLLIMLSGLSTYGQVYDVIINGRMNPINTDLEYTGACRVWGGIDFELDVYRGDPQPFFYDFEVVSGFSDITLEISYQPWSIGTTCQFSQTRTFSEEEAVGTSYAAQVSAFCSSGTLYADFFPRIAIQRTGPNAGSTEICAGDVLQLTTTEGGFPDLIYNWQYQLPDTFVWLDVPFATTGARGISFTIGQLLGQDHMNYLGEDIVFRLGNSSRQFGNGYRITYSACGPLVDTIDYSPPACSGDPVNVTVNFNEPLAGSLADGIQNGDERLSTIYIVDALDSSLFFEQQNQVNMDVNGGTAFTFNDVSGLTEGRAYNIRYQVEKRINNQWQLRGFIESPPSESFTYVDPPLLVFNSATTWGPARCAGQNSGSLILHVSGGTGNYRYQIDGTGPWLAFTPHAINPVTETLSPGPHTVRVRDNNNCEISNTGTVGQPDGITFSSSPAIPSTTYNGGSDANITISNVQGGAGTKRFNWTKQGGGDSSFPRTTQSLTEISAGTYILTITDDNNCSVTRNFSVAEPLLINISLSEPIRNVVCRGQNNGTISVNVIGGISGYRYEWFKLNEVTSIFETTSITTSNLSASAGTFHVMVTDNNGSGHAVTSDNYTINDPDDLQFSTTPINVSCKGESIGEIDLNIIGGTPPYNVIWERDGSIFSTDEDISGLSAGLYRLTLTDFGGCTPINNSLDYFIEITEPDESIEIEKVTHINNNINGGTIGELVITANGGSGSYIYSWTWNGNPFIPPAGSTDSHLINLSAGDYRITVTSGICSVSLSATITEPNLLEITSAIPTPVNCYGESTGGVKLSVNGGIGPYHYQWFKQGDALFTGSDTDEITGLSIGLYDVVVTDSSGSIANVSTSVEVTQNTEIAITLNNLQNNICYNDNQGIIDITVTGGTAPYTYQWSNGATSENINTLQTGSYSVVVTDALGCTMSGSYEITQPTEAVSISNIEVVQITANGYNDGAINLTISGGATPYTFDWFSDNGFTSTSEDISNLTPGHYTVIVFDGNYAASGSSACAAVQEFEIIEPDVLEVNITEELSLFCYGDTHGKIMANVSGGVPPYRYTWYRVAGTNTLLGADTVSIDNLGTGSYQVVITDVNNIEATSEIFNLSEPNELLLEITSATHVLCHGESTGAIDMQITGGTTPYYINWSHGATTEDLLNIPAGTYTITVEDTNGCIKEQTVSILNVSDALQITTINLRDVTSFDGTDGSLTIGFTGGASPYSIEWIKLSTGEIVGTTTAINNLTADNYRVTIEDTNGCSITEIYTITEPDVVVASIANATCVDSCDGSISLVVDQGNGIYTYTWSNGSTSSNITNLCAGTYTVAIGGYGNGNRILERTYEIIDPEAFVIDIGEDRTLCEGQTHEIDATINDAGAIYQWTSDNGFTNTNPSVEITESGTYNLTITNSIGCQATDTIIISRTQEVINSEFAISSQVFTGESVVVVNISNPTPDSVKWILPEAGEIIEKNSDFAEMVFNAPGEYSFGMITRLGDCEAYQEKTVVVIDREELTESEEEQKSERIPSIIEFKIYPNPSSGQFTLDVELKQIQNISLKVFALTNNSMVDFRVNHNKDKYTEYYDLSRVASGMYFILIETPTTTQIKKIIID